MKAFLEVLSDTSSLTAAVTNATAYYTNAAFEAPFDAADVCNSADSLVAMTTQGPAYTGRSLGYDYSLFSYVGCRCSGTDTHRYTVYPTTGNAMSLLDMHVHVGCCC